MCSTYLAALSWRAALNNAQKSAFGTKTRLFARAYHLLQKIDLGPERGSERGPLLEFNIGSHPGDSTHYVNAKDMLSLSLLQARLIDLGMPIKIVEDT